MFQVNVRRKRYLLSSSVVSFLNVASTQNSLFVLSIHAFCFFAPTVPSLYDVQAKHRFLRVVVVFCQLEISRGPFRWL